MPSRLLLRRVGEHDVVVVTLEAPRSWRLSCQQALNGAIADGALKGSQLSGLDMQRWGEQRQPGDWLVQGAA